MLSLFHFVRAVLYKCADGYTSYFDTDTKFCLKMVERHMTKAEANNACASHNGRVASLIEIDKHESAAQLAKERIFNGKAFFFPTA